MENFKKLSIIIPVFNEEATIVEILKLVLNVKLINDIKKEIIIVDDFSTDDTAFFVKNFKKENPDYDINLIQQSKNQGKGAAIHTGIKEATGELIIIQDADLEYDPEEYNILLNPFVKGFADVVYGSRFAGGEAHRILFYWHSIGNKLLTKMSNMFTNLNLTDMETCYKLFRSDIIKNIKLKEKRFGFEPEVTAKISKIKNIRVYEVGISYYGRTYKEGKKIKMIDGFRAFWCIIKYNLFA